MNRPFLSYVVPCYNMGYFLPRCINSLKRQQILGAEVEFVMVNDGSTDNTLSVLNQFAEDDDRVVVVDQPNQGVCAARNHGLEVAQGEYVFFLDGDDWMTDDASEIIYQFCKKEMPNIAIFSNYKVYEEQPDKSFSWIDCSKHISSGIYEKRRYVEETAFIPMSFKLYQTKFLKKNNIRFDEQLRVGELYTFFILGLTLADTIGVSHQYVMNYLKRKDSSATTEVNVERDLSALDTLHTINMYVNGNYAELQNHKSFLAPLFFLITAFTLIKYIGRGEYTSDKGRLIKAVKNDDDYKSLLKYFTTTGLSLSKYSYLALSIRFLPAKFTYNLLRSYYKYATRNI